MIIKKIGGSLVATIAMLTLGNAALADDYCATESNEIKYMSDMLICSKDGGQWSQPIWQYQGKKGDGCVIHSKLAKLLYVPRDPDGTKPPVGGKNGKGGNLASGAANDLVDHKYQSALEQLQGFQNTIEFDAKLNPENPTAAKDAENWRTWAMGMQGKVKACMPTT